MQFAISKEMDCLVGHSFFALLCIIRPRWEHTPVPTLVGNYGTAVQQASSVCLELPADALWRLPSQLFLTFDNSKSRRTDMYESQSYCNMPERARSRMGFVQRAGEKTVRRHEGMRHEAI